MRINRDKSFSFRPVLINVCNSKENSCANSTEKAVIWMIRIGCFQYSGDQLVADPRCDLLWGMPWGHVDHNAQAE